MSILIFDLDGTLIDTSKIVLSAFIKAISQFSGVALPTEKTMLDTFGLPDKQIWKNLMPDCSNEMRHTARNLSGEYIQEGLSESDILIEGARSVLEHLQKRGHTLTVASNCGTDYLNGVLDSQGIRDYFVRPLCLESVSGLVKADIIAAHVQHFGKTDCVMIGDRNTDIEAARFHEIPAIGCDFGFGNSEELAGANRVIHHLSELLDIFG